MICATSEKTRHLILRAQAGEALPDSLVRELTDQAVVCGWLRASGVLRDVELRTLDAEGNEATRRIAGPVHVVALEGSVGIAGGEVSVGLRAVIARESDRGLETLAGEIARARVVALEAYVTSFEDVGVGRALDREAGVWLLGEPGASATPAPRHAPRAPNPPAAWNEAIAASAPEPPRRPPAPTPPQTAAVMGGPIPAPLRRPGAALDLDAPFPEAGDIVEHFALGRCEVIKSDGDRLHVRLPNGRITEIATDRLKMSLLAAAEGDGRRTFKLERKL